MLKTTTLETIDSYPQNAIHAYTDGSAFKATIKAGYGALIKYPNTHWDDHPRIFGACGEFCSNYTAEITAIEKALQHIIKDFDSGTTPPEDIIIFSDSKSTLQAIEGGVLADVAEISELVDLLFTSYGIKVIFQWIPRTHWNPGQ